ncbi:hypothetical protein HOLleu_25150 [Holothuria leucospilota]|uniref:Uncharacterized protein n=1 Tax=Holothuria leucospilota TaxID=206669 RepID=A0A9Q1BS83_HOLLE|nr:hypothetical protein HOLleu_25150 [Holothuria leucospilota]
MGASIFSLTVVKQELVTIIKTASCPPSLIVLFMASQMLLPDSKCYQPHAPPIPVPLVQSLKCTGTVREGNVLSTVRPKPKSDSPV